MNHPHPDELLLFASGELAELRIVEVASHLATCAACQGALTQLERALVALEGGLPRRTRARNRPLLWAGFALGAAAVLAVLLIRQPDESARRRAGPPRPRGRLPLDTWPAARR